MNETEATKVCPHCAETIKAAAKVCPHCRFWQRKWSLQNPQVMVVILLIFCMAMFAGLGTIWDKLFGPKEDFETYRDDISVVSSQFSTRPYGSNIYVFVFGTLTNHSKVGWKEVAVEAQLFNRSGNLIDTIVASTDEYRGTVILPHGEATYKVEGRAAQPVSDYDSCKASVHWAKDVAAWP
ncbi:MAG TPA: hypothetical protein VK731_09710 [Candidatus Cybelea sp.]|nr:hypothetical protein [Candidatus Cybelea sp.]